MCSAAPSPSPSTPAPLSAEDVQDCLRLAESVDEATREAGQAAGLPAGRPRPLPRRPARHRRRLPELLLEEALAAGYRPDPDDLAALRALRGAVGRRGAAAALPGTGRARVRTRLARPRCRAPPAQPPALAARRLSHAGPAGRPTAVSGGKPTPPQPVPKPSEVFPPRRKPVAPPAQHLAQCNSSLSLVITFRDCQAACR